MMGKQFAPELRLLLISLCAGFLFATAMVVVTRAQGLDMVSLTGDAGNYLQLTSNLLSRGEFTSATQPPFYPESFRSPGYPVYLALFFGIFHDWLVVLLLQVIVMSVAPVLLYILFKPMHERAAWWGSVIFALEPTRLFLSASFLTDALFTCLFLGSLILIEWGRKKNLLAPFLFAGIVLGVSILVRPIAMFLPLVYALYLLLVRKTFSRVYIALFLLLIASAITVFPWMLRNHKVFHSWSISSVGAANLMIYNAPAFLADHPDTRGAEVLARFREEQKAFPGPQAISLERSSAFTSTFKEVIRGREFSYGIFHVLKTIPFFVTDGLREIVRVCGVGVGNPPNISSLLFSGNLHTIFSYLKSGGVTILLLGVGSGFFILALFLFLFASLRILQGKLLTRAALLFVALVFYFALLTGPVSNARYRNPVTGLIVVLALSVILKDNQQHNESPKSY